jgi:hypothetical protein
MCGGTYRREDRHRCCISSFYAKGYAKEEHDSTGFEWGEDSQTDSFLKLIATKSESSLFGTPDKRIGATSKTNPLNFISVFLEQDGCYDLL